MIDHLDHLVLTATDRAACIDLYTRALGMQLETFGAGRTAFRFGDQNRLKPEIREWGALIRASGTYAN